MQASTRVYILTSSSLVIPKSQGPQKPVDHNYLWRTLGLHRPWDGHWPLTACASSRVSPRKMGPEANTEPQPLPQEASFQSLPFPTHWDNPLLASPFIHSSDKGCTWKGTPDPGRPQESLLSKSSQSSTSRGILHFFLHSATPEPFQRLWESGTKWGMVNCSAEFNRNEWMQN